MRKVFNFSAGPSMLPEEVLKKAQAELLDYRGCGMSVMELSHRSSEFKQIITDAEANLRTILGIPSNYKVLFMQGGGTTQFAAVPMNLFRGGKAAYIDTGTWSHQAIAEAKKYGPVEVVASSEADGFREIPDCSRLSLPADTDYLYYCKNNTVYGTEFKFVPDAQGHRLVADVSSDFLSRPMDITTHDLVWAGAQKNAGIAGNAIVIVKEELLRSDLPAYVPSILSYKNTADKGSIYNTPAVYAIYISGLYFEWVLSVGGLKEIARRNDAKNALLWGYLDSQSYYTPRVSDKASRSTMNVDFTLPTKELDAEFCARATEEGLKTLKGHRLIGGIRASIYNAMPLEGVERLVDFMKAFAKEKNA